VKGGLPPTIKKETLLAKNKGEKKKKGVFIWEKEKPLSSTGSRKRSEKPGTEKRERDSKRKEKKTTFLPWEDPSWNLRGGKRKKKGSIERQEPKETVRPEGKGMVRRKGKKKFLPPTGGKKVFISVKKGGEGKKKA